MSLSFTKLKVLKCVIMCSDNQANFPQKDKTNVFMPLLGRGIIHVLRHKGSFVNPYNNIQE